MQPTRMQVQRSLDALEDGQLDELRHYQQRASPAHEFPAGLADWLAAADPVRADRIADALLRLRSGDVPTADDVADRLVDRLVCDRLR